MNTLDIAYKQYAGLRADLATSTVSDNAVQALRVAAGRLLTEVRCLYPGDHCPYCEASLSSLKHSECKTNYFADWIYDRPGSYDEETLLRSKRDSID